MNFTEGHFRGLMLTWAIILFVMDSCSKLFGLDTGSSLSFEAYTADIDIIYS